MDSDVNRVMMLKESRGDSCGRHRTSTVFQDR